MANKESYVSRSYVLLWLGRFGSSLIFSLMSATVAAFCLEYYECNAALAGVAVGTFIIFGLLSRFFAGRYVDVMGRKQMLVVSAAVYCLSTALFIVPMPFIAFLAVRAVQGFAFGFFSNTLNVVMVGIVPESRLGESMSVFALASTSATAIGPFFGLWLMQNVSSTAMFIACALFGLISLVSTLLIHVDPVELDPEERERLTKSFDLRDSFEMSITPVALICTFCCMLNSAPNSFMATYAGTLNMVELASWYFVVNAIVQFATRPLMGRIFDKKGADAAIYPSLMGFVVGFIVLSLSPFCPWLILVGGALMAFGFGSSTSSLQALAIKNLPPNRMGAGIAAFFLFLDAGTGLGPMLFGALVVPAGGYPQLFCIEIALAVLTIALYYVIRKHFAKSED